VESLGEKLKTVREERDWSYDYISREINISAKYLEALEREDFSVFPGEPYVLGFLKNYGEFLGLNQEEVLSLYRSLKIQEQPIPMKELLKGPSPLPKILRVVAVILVLLGLAAGVMYMIPRLPQRAQIVPQQARTAAEYTMNAEFLERRFYPGDSILITEGVDSYRLVFTSLGDAVNIITPRGPVILDLGQEVTINLSDNDFTELRIIAADFVRNDSTSGALLRFEQTVLPQAASGVMEEVPSEALTAAGREISTIIPSTPNAFPFTLQAVFQGLCLFRYEILFERDRPGRSEQYYQRTQELSITAQNGIRLGISNAQAVRLQVVGGGRTVPFEAGNAGEVVAADLRWVRDEDNRFRLVLTRLD